MGLHLLLWQLTPPSFSGETRELKGQPRCVLTCHRTNRAADEAAGEGSDRQRDNCVCQPEGSARLQEHLVNNI